MKKCICGAMIPSDLWCCPNCNYVFVDVDAPNECLEINKCPECGASTVPQEGCEYCPACGWSKCG